MARNRLLSSPRFSFRPGIEQLEDRAVPSIDLNVTKTDGLTAVAAGETIQYTVVVSNSSGATQTAGSIPFTDTLPTNLTNVSYTSTATGGASGNTGGGGNPVTVSGTSFSDTLTLPAGSSVTYTVRGTVSPTAAVNDTVVNIAAANTAGYTNTGTATASDTDTVKALDLAVTKTTPDTSVAPGQSVTYTIVASNPAGGADAVGATLTDALPAGLTNVTYTSKATGGASGNTASGTGNINETNLTLLAGSTITYTVHALVSQTAPNGTTFQNTAAVGAPSGTTDANTGNNSSTAPAQTVSVPTSPVNLSISKTDKSKFAVSGQPVTYTITVTNLGTTTAAGATVSDTLPSGFTSGSVSWTSSYSTGATGASGSGNINDTITLAAGQSITYTLTGTVSNSATGSLVNTATVTPASGITDTDTTNNTATDRDTILPKAVPAYFNQFAVGADAGAQGHVKVYAPDGTLRFSFLAFQGFNGGVRVATGDVNRDGVNDIIVSAGFGAPGGHVKVFDGVDGRQIASFFSFENFLGGTNVAVGDVNNDGFGDLIVGSGLGAGHVKVFSFASGAPQLLDSFFAYPGYRGGITVASGDVNGDGFDDIVTGTEQNAHLKVISLATGVPVDIFSQIVVPNYSGGIDVAAGNLRGDDRAEFLFAPQSPAGGGGAVQIFSIDSGSPIASFVPTFPTPAQGLRIGVADADNDGDLDIIVASGPGRAALVQVYDATSLNVIKEFTAFENFLGGVNVG